MSEKAREEDITNRVSVGGMGLRPGIPVVATIVAAIMLSIIAESKVLLGREFQRCPSERDGVPL